eukprot:CAMPEP_0206431958 /NCGR_PEP_ID=MMETSP0324_2-20121206/7647_1 /ASSEMBLY_ACC=CAM_ASM_000836 /TAXON_ID=2866 /ORGANISM="Crypthecodinium cohnii, Strain Seligo" /LENGTH=433 /DNA_ID=CAMNT_0053897931 /DNA_START=37 /DNA_END=1338 /DNA_ORIENTATION=+
MSRTCEKCNAPWKGYGQPCSTCRKGGNEWSHCPQCSAHFKGSGLCMDCRGSNAGTVMPENVKVTDQPGGKCAECGKDIGYGESVTISGKEYHPDCFSCSKCKKPISGPHKVEDGKRICKICLDTKLCEGCNRPLGVGVATVLNGKSYHPECLTCAACTKVLTGKFRPYEDKLFCLGCGENPEAALLKAGKKAPARALDRAGDVCAGCLQTIVGTVTSANGSTFHPECFKCTGCATILGDKFFGSSMGVLCEACAKKPPAPPPGGVGKEAPGCSKCGQTITGSYKKMNDGTFNCSTCSPADNCGGCGKVITGKYLDFEGQRYHQACFKCEDCDKCLAGESIYKGPEQQRLCKGCVEERRDSTQKETVGMCMKCGKVLNGKYLIVEEMKFHKECFTCDRCHEPIEGAYHIEQPSGRYSIKVMNFTRKKFICPTCD